MAVVMQMRWAGATLAQYDALRQVVNWEGDHPVGGMYHVAWFQDGAMHVCDVWESAEAFNQFVEKRLMPGVQQVGILGQPEVVIHPAHATFAPGYRAK